MKKIFLYIVVVVFLLGTGAFGFWFYQTKLATQPRQAPEVLPTPTPTPTLIPTPTPITESESGKTKTDLELIAEAFSRKYDKPLEEVEVTMNKNTGTYASGGIKFKGEIAGGWWLGAKENGEWVIVADGNGTVMCSSIEGYDFPADMVPECWDEEAGKLIYRE